MTFFLQDCLDAVKDNTLKCTPPAQSAWNKSGQKAMYFKFSKIMNEMTRYEVTDI